MSAPTERAAVSPDFSRIASVSDYEALAKQQLPADVWSYIHSGAGDGLSATRNLQAFDQLVLRPRVLRRPTAATASIALLGQQHTCPMLIAPMAYQGLLHPDAEWAVAQAASALGIGWVVSTQAGVRLEELARACTAPRWFQLYPQPQLADSIDLLRRAEQSGYQAIVVTVDAPIQGFRHADQRAGFKLPAHIQAVNLAPYDKPMPEVLEAGASVFSHRLVQDMADWEMLAALVAQTKLPVLIKGIVHPLDAELALGAGAAGIIISNHGGRVLDGVMAPLRALPDVLAAVANQVPVLVDGGVRRGTDVLKCLALGAQAVLIGRAVLYALAAAGATGVAHVLHLLRSELEMAMVLCGARTVAELIQADLIEPV